MTARTGFLAMAMMCSVRLASAQVTPAAELSRRPTTRRRSGWASPSSPTTRFRQSPKTTDADGNSVNANAFNVRAHYINVTGNISHLVAFRITPDIAREAQRRRSALNGSLVFRIKYAYAQFNLDDWMTEAPRPGFGIQQTPWVDFAEGIYRYRFQGTVFAERAGYFASADAGVSFHYQLPSNYGDVHVGVYNGENYHGSRSTTRRRFNSAARCGRSRGDLVVLRGIRAHRRSTTPTLRQGRAAQALHRRRSSSSTTT